MICRPRRVTGAESPALAQVIALYEAAFPARERKPASAIVAMATSPDHRILVLEEADATVAGFAILLVTQGHDCAVLEYLAVRPELRGRGLGARLFRESLNVIREPGPRGLLFEVESEREEASDRAARLARKRFYRALGCLEIADIDYVLPLPGVGAPPLLDLMTAPDPHLGALDRERLKRWITELYVGGYGQAPDDPRIEATVSRTPDPVLLI